MIPSGCKALHRSLMPLYSKDLLILGGRLERREEIWPFGSMVALLIRHNKPVLLLLANLHSGPTSMEASEWILLQVIKSWVSGPVHNHLIDC